MSNGLSWDEVMELIDEQLARGEQEPRYSQAEDWYEAARTSDLYQNWFPDQPVRRFTRNTRVRYTYRYDSPPGTREWIVHNHPSITRIANIPFPQEDSSDD